MRQFRTAENDCSPPSILNQNLRACKDTGSSNNKLPYGPGNIYQWTRTGQRVWAPSGAFYPAGGFSILLSPDMNTAVNAIAILQNDSWIDDQVRMSITLYLNIENQIESLYSFYGFTVAHTENFAAQTRYKINFGLHLYKKINNRV